MENQIEKPVKKLDKKTEKDLWRQYMIAQEDLYCFLDLQQNHLYVCKTDTSDDLKYRNTESLFHIKNIETAKDTYNFKYIPQYPHAVVMLDDGSVKRRDFLHFKESLEDIYERIKGTRYRRKHPKYIEGPIETIKISEKTAVSSVSITEDSGKIALGTLSYRAEKIDELKAKCINAGLPITIVFPSTFDDIKNLSFTTSPSELVVQVEAVDLLAFAKADQLQRRIITGPQIISHIRQPGDRAMRVPAGLIVVDYQEGLKATPIEPRKRRADNIYTVEAEAVEFDQQAFEPIKIAGMFYRR